jgi:phosphatidylserine/phosphatidylglycerophosphate/cardiolipin synthase-like enzyme
MPLSHSNRSELVSVCYLILLLSLVCLPLAACQDQASEKPSTSSTAILPPQPDTINWVQVYFSDPTGPNAETLRGGPDKFLADAIRRARLSVDVAVYDLDLWSIRDALLEAFRRGVEVRMVTDSDNLEEKEIQELKDAGIAVLGDRSQGLMHHKFTVIDGQDVWTGSMNYTLNSAYRNDDNLIHIHSPELAVDYTTEFNEMFVEDRFGPKSLANTPQPNLIIDGSPVEVYFSPDDGVEAHIVELIRSAGKSIKFMAYSFTSDKIGQAMVKKSQEGVQVSGIFEEEQTRSNRGTEYDRLDVAGLDIHLDGNPRNMHHKVIIIDDAIVITGSYNFSNNAETSNDENLLVIHDPQVAAYYAKEFQRVISQSQP